MPLFESWFGSTKKFTTIEERRDSRAEPAPIHEACPAHTEVPKLQRTESTNRNCSRAKKETGDSLNCKLIEAIQSRPFPNSGPFTTPIKVNRYHSKSPTKKSFVTKSRRCVTYFGAKVMQFDQAPLHKPYEDEHLQLRPPEVTLGGECWGQINGPEAMADRRDSIEPDIASQTCHAISSRKIKIRNVTHELYLGKSAYVVRVLRNLTTIKHVPFAAILRSI
ncbi:hypothetical protein H4582DRAFT_2053563 [Lactarius indigo]|nr:hypothetical protein H4582DRAFT_2053563 [Lactarius indigo]